MVICQDCKHCHFVEMYNSGNYFCLKEPNPGAKRNPIDGKFQRWDDFPKCMTKNKDLNCPQFEGKKPEPPAKQWYQNWPFSMFFKQSND